MKDIVGSDDKQTPEAVSIHDSYNTQINREMNNIIFQFPGTPGGTKV